MVFYLSHLVLQALASLASGLQGREKRAAEMGKRKKSNSAQSSDLDDPAWQAWPRTGPWHPTDRSAGGRHQRRRLCRKYQGPGGKPKEAFSTDHGAPPFGQNGGLCWDICTWQISCVCTAAGARPQPMSSQPWEQWCKHLVDRCIDRRTADVQVAAGWLAGRQAGMASKQKMDRQMEQAGCALCSQTVVDLFVHSHPKAVSSWVGAMPRGCVHPI